MMINTLTNLDIAPSAHPTSKFPAFARGSFLSACHSRKAGNKKCLLKDLKMWNGEGPNTRILEDCDFHPVHLGSALRQYLWLLPFALKPPPGCCWSLDHVSIAPWAGAARRWFSDGKVSPVHRFERLGLGAGMEIEMCFGNCDSTTRNAWETGSPRAILHIETGYVLSIHIHPNDVSPAPPTPRNGSAPPTGGSYPSRLKKHVAIPRVFVLVSASPDSHSHNLRDTKMFDQRWWDDEISEILAGPRSQFVFWTVLSVSIFGEHLLWLAQGKYCRIDSSYLSI